MYIGIKATPDEMTQSQDLQACWNAVDERETHEVEPSGGGNASTTPLLNYNSLIAISSPTDHK